MLISLVFITGCDLFNNDSLEDINIVTTIYPTEYITKRLFGNNSNIKSIYPKGTKVIDYKITNKIIKDLSSNDMFIYNGESIEKDYALSLLKENKSLKIGDAAYGIMPNYITDVWLNPSNILMMASNIKNELEIYLTNPYLINEVSNEYELLKLDISGLETEFKKVADNGTDLRIISADESLKFLEKYGFIVINLTENEKPVEKNIETARALLNNKKKSYIYVVDNKNTLEIVNTLVTNDNASILSYRTLEILTDNDLENNEDYLSLMLKNIELLKKDV